MQATGYRGRRPVHEGITPELIEDLVATFYARIREDRMLGGIFDPIIGNNWPAHLARMCAFWRSVMLLTGEYKGKPNEAHARIEILMPVHYDRWLTLWADTVNRLCPPDVAFHFVQKAERMADTLMPGAPVPALPAMIEVRP